ncbi:MAG: YtoQ family protein [gamma proteobacterium symbiont of Bathyaustriella thionipta]|nr:YtoQ family protein [gamma proteobacterium symbiont of Bathyaustriella thionipta]MCU7949419.1 YtoQ family protein [gamma proteobacterium symbiont of Bathyaustriella thionipta]MCU7953087.1 YtoQ family protein [gamma proteobacterium symbiont of Bathyaustriella thionipta]MCU7956006.1 YtoQ family protein [gamma proteobacterium symbiont of Bathyaustriella thionipta]MCU7968951.1 YtoQ family protein [gamma proteobacterium symbiont of Bathyaustriella thionipta]
MSNWSVYLSGEIHTDWRETIINGVQQAGLTIEFTSAVTDHAASDDVGEAILGKEESVFWRDHKAAKINAIRTQKAIREADVVVVRFGDKYRQWNAAFDAGFASALGKSLITLHDDALTHPLKEVNGAAMTSANSAEQVVEILTYLLKQK